jgi:hypothetical protein
MPALVPFKANGKGSNVDLVTRRKIADACLVEATTAHQTF